jgi:hypothetical protein
MLAIAASCVSKMPVRVCSGVGCLLLGKGKKWGWRMQDMLAQLEKLRKDAEDCELIGKLATDPKKRELFERLAAHLKVLATEVERVMLESRN